MSIVLVGSTSGSCTLQEQAVAGTTVLTLPTTSGTVSLDGPAFSAYANAGVTLSANVWTKVPLQLEYFDTASAFDSTTNYRFTPTVAGYYQINGQVFNGAFAGGIVGAAIYKNGTLAHAKSMISNGAQGTCNTCSSVIYLNGSTDFVELFAFMNGTATLATTGTSDTAMSGSLIRGA